MDRDHLIIAAMVEDRGGEVFIDHSALSRLTTDYSLTITELPTGLNLSLIQPLLPDSRRLLFMAFGFGPLALLNIADPSRLTTRARLALEQLVVRNLVVCNDNRFAAGIRPLPAPLNFWGTAQAAQFVANNRPTPDDMTPFPLTKTGDTGV